MNMPRLVLAVLIMVSALPAAAGPSAVEQVRFLLEEDRWQEALALAEEGGPGTDRDTALGEALYRAGRLAEAAELLARVVDHGDPPPVRALVQLGLVRTAEGRGREGAALLRQALEAAPDDPWVLYRAAGAAGSREQVVRVLERYLELAAEQDPDRAEGARGTIRLLTALGDRETWILQDRPKTAVVDLRKVPGKTGVVRGYTFKGVVGTRKKPVRILLDTGSTGFYLDRQTARKHAMEPVSTETVFGGGGSGRHRSDRGLVSLQVAGSLRFTDALAMTSETRLDPAASFRGLIGLDPFAGYVITLDLARGALHLETPPPSGDPWPGEGWSRGARYWTVSGQMLVEAGDAGGAQGLFILDTGATRSLVSDTFVRQVDGVALRGAGAVRGFGGVRAGSRRADGVDLRFQGLTGDNGAVGVADLALRSRLSGVEISGFIGLDMLAGQVLRIDTLARRVFVKEQGRKR